MASKREDSNYGVNLTVLRKVKVIQAGAEVKHEVTLNDIWSRQTTVLIFLRRFHCPYSKLAAAEMSKISQQIKDKNARLVGIGCGWSGSDEFLKREYLSGNLYVDATAEAYKACKFRVEGYANALGILYSSKARSETAKAKSLGYGGHFKAGGNSWQDGGVLIVDRGGGRIVHLWRQTSAMDRCDNATILSALDLMRNGDSDSEHHVEERRTQVQHVQEEFQ